MMHTPTTWKDIEPGKKYVILRLDDIQAFAWKESARAVMDEVIKRNATMSLAVIPINLRDDLDTIRYLQKNHEYFELTQHGWNNSLTNGRAEFEDLSKEEAKEKILAGRKIIEPINDYAPITFIPPDNQYSNGTLDALKEEGFKILSSEGNHFFDYDASTYDFDDRYFIGAEQVLYNCKKALDEKNVCVIMMHPQDFVYANGTINPKKFEQFTLMMDKLSKADIEFRTFGDFVHDPDVYRGFIG